MSHFLYFLTTVSNQRKLSNFKSSKLDSQRSNFCVWELTKFFSKGAICTKKMFSQVQLQVNGADLRNKIGVNLHINDYPLPKKILELSCFVYKSNPKLLSFLKISKLP